MKLSIVVPIYNVETYIARCAQSLINQTADKDTFEVIFVNDGTRDNSIAVLYEVIDFKKYKNFHLVEKENGGLSSARNYGMNHVKGDYVWFLDSDDWIDIDSVEKILPFLAGVDALPFVSYYRETIDDTIVDAIDINVITGRCMTLLGQYRIPVPFTIYNCHFLNKNGLTFHEGILFEDLHFSPRALYMANTIAVLRFPVYHYFQREGSIMSSDVSRKRILDRIWISQDLYKFSKKYILEEDVKYWSDCIAVDINAVMYDVFRSKKKELRSIAKSYINSEKHLTECLRFSRNMNNRIWYYLSKICFGNFYQVYKILYKIRY